MTAYMFILFSALLLVFTLVLTRRAPARAEDASDGLFASRQPVSDSPAWVQALPSARDTEVKQLFIVAAAAMDRTTATVSMHQRDERGEWKQILSTPGFVGRNGLCPGESRVEGCLKTPVGVFRFNRAFGIAPDPGCALPYVQVTEDTCWSGDPGCHYNEMVSLREHPELDLARSEHLLDYTFQYQYCLNIGFHPEGTPGRGSAIFLHCFGPQNPYTAGCVALPENIMKLVMQRVQPGCLAVIDTLEHLTGSC